MGYIFDKRSIYKKVGRVVGRRWGVNVVEECKCG